MADEYKPGSMNIEEQERTFEGFVTWVKYATVIIIAALIFLALVNA